VKVSLLKTTRVCSSPDLVPRIRGTLLSVGLLLLRSWAFAGEGPATLPPPLPHPLTNLPSSSSHVPSAIIQLFDGRTLTGWRETAFGGRGEIECKSGQMVFNMGDPFTGINYTNEFPKMNYEVSLEAMRVMGSDFFCGLTVPVGDSFCSLIVGGWGGSLVGISSLDGEDASENETTRFVNFEAKRWYHIRLRVTTKRLEAWIDNDKMVDVVTPGRRISLRLGDIELSKPFGIASWQTTAALRNIRLLRVTGPADPVPKGRD